MIPSRSKFVGPNLRRSEFTGKLNILRLKVELLEIADHS